jgi:hypothetical protein
LTTRAQLGPITTCDCVAQEKLSIAPSLIRAQIAESSKIRVSAVPADLFVIDSDALRADDEVVIDEMPYLGVAHVDEGEVVVANIDATEYVKSRF